MPCFTAAEITGLKDGHHRLVAYGLDAALNRSGALVYRWTVDTIAPGLVLSGTPASGGTTSAQEANFEIMKSEPSEVFCSLDGGDFHGCGSHVAFSDLAAGPHTFAAYVVDRAGNESIEAGWSWTIA